MVHFQFDVHTKHSYQLRVYSGYTHSIDQSGKHNFDMVQAVNERVVVYYINHDQAGATSEYIKH